MCIFLDSTFVHVVGHPIVYVEISQPSLPPAHVPKRFNGTDPNDEHNILDGFSDYFKLHTLDMLATIPLLDQFAKGGTLLTFLMVVHLKCDHDNGGWVFALSLVLLHVVLSDMILRSTCWSPYGTWVAHKVGVNTWSLTVPYIVGLCRILYKRT